MTGERPQIIQFSLPQCERQAIRFADTAMLIVQAVIDKWLGRHAGIGKKRKAT